MFNKTWLLIMYSSLFLLSFSSVKAHRKLQVPSIVSNDHEKIQLGDVNDQLGKEKDHFRKLNNDAHISVNKKNNHNQKKKRRLDDEEKCSAAKYGCSIKGESQNYKEGYYIREKDCIRCSTNAEDVEK